MIRKILRCIFPSPCGKGERGVVCAGLLCLRRLARFFCPVLFFIYNAHAEPSQLPQDAIDRHLGAASCATSVCHGKAAPVKDGHVALNEYRVWSTEDRHARAYQVLSNELSKRIAVNLGLPSAQTAKICLDCHADNVAPAQRGPKFQLSDGVACEACHGGSQRWIKTHTDPSVAHKANIAQGMFPTDDAYARATLCLSCHQGTADKFANHQIMAAGHPRLMFDLDAFSANQPAHYVIDADYKARKGAPAIGTLWLAGQVESGRQLANLIDQHVGAGFASELAVFDCHACHHPMQPPRGRPADFSAVLPVGSLRLLDNPYDMLAAVYAVVAPGERAAWEEAVRALHRASSKPGQIRAATAEIRRQLQALESTLRAHPPGVEKIRALRSHIAAQGAAGRYADFTSAEQAYLALDGLSYALGDRDRQVRALDEIYKAVADEHNYQPARFAQASRAFSR